MNQYIVIYSHRYGADAWILKTDADVSDLNEMMAADLKTFAEFVGCDTFDEDDDETIDFRTIHEGAVVELDADELRLALITAKLTNKEEA